MQANSLIFGINGQDGFYLNSLLNNNNVNVIGISRSNSQFTIGDVSDYEFVERLIKHYKPGYIFHFAANSTTRHDAIFENFQTITNGTLNILESVNRHSKHSKVFIAGSGLQFVNTGDLISETDPFEAKDSYSMSRIQAIYTARYYRELGVRVYVGYLFNHDSPMRSARHINQRIVQTAQRIAAGSPEKLILGDVTVKKEFTFAGDIVRAIWKLINNDTIFETVIGSGEAYSIAYWTDLCFKHYNLNWQDHFAVDAGFSSNHRILVSDPATMASLGWRPGVSIDQLALMMLQHAKQ
jgi:GDPmannose 4,6-dehydratase